MEDDVRMACDSAACEHRCCINNRCGYSFMECNGWLIIGGAALGGFVVLLLVTVLCWKLSCCLRRGHLVSAGGSKPNKVAEKESEMYNSREAYNLKSTTDPLQMTTTQDLSGIAPNARPGSSGLDNCYSGAMTGATEVRAKSPEVSRKITTGEQPARHMDFAASAPAVDLGRVPAPAPERFDIVNLSRNPSPLGHVDELFGEDDEASANRRDRHGMSLQPNMFLDDVGEHRPEASEANVPPSTKHLREIP